MIIRSLHLFFLVAAILTDHSALASSDLVEIGKTYKLTFTDVDQQELSTADGHVTIIAVMVKADADKARILGERVPTEYKGNPVYRLVTLINFKKAISRVLQPATKAIIRYQLDREAPRIQSIYKAKGLDRHARRDLFVIADFDGTAVATLGLDVSNDTFSVFLFNREGRLLRRWNDVPSAVDLAAALRTAG
jgi:hypothetical protein